MEQNHKEIFYQLMEEARKQIPRHPQAEQVTVLRTERTRYTALPCRMRSMPKRSWKASLECSGKRMTAG